MEVDVTGVSVPRLSRASAASFAKTCVAAIGRLRAAPFKATELTILLVHDEEMIQLNHSWRGRKKTTDVLTFEADESYAPPESEGRPLGDIVISVDQARRQAAEQRHSLATEIRYLILHGIIHAYGYDHESDRGEMNTLERKVRSKVGLE